MLALPESDIFNFKFLLKLLIEERLDAGFSNYKESNM